MPPFPHGPRSPQVFCEEGSSRGGDAFGSDFAMRMVP